MVGKPTTKFVPVQARGTLTLPAGVRRRHRLDEPGAQVEIVDQHAATGRARRFDSNEAFLTRPDDLVDGAD